ncbi:MarR family winged helix-turn-helix transcriptional regulator [Cellulomonas hominis]
MFPDQTAAPDAEPGTRRDVAPGDELFSLLHSTMRRFRRDVHAELEPLGVTPSQHRLLHTLDRAGAPQRHSQLAVALGVVPRSVTSVVDDMEAAGLVRRSADPTDRRATLVELTPEGRAVLEAARRQRRRRADDLLSGLSPAETSELLRLLRRLAEAAEC